MKPLEKREVIKRIQQKKYKKKTEGQKQTEAKWRLFADLYMESGNAVQAYLDAGYSGTPETARGNASRLSRHPYVVAYIEKKTRGLATEFDSYETLPPEIKEATVADKDEVLSMLTSIIRDPLAAPNARIRAVEELAKLKGFYKEKVEQESSENLKQTIQDILGITDED